MFKILSMPNFRWMLDVLACLAVLAALEWAIRQPESQAELGIANSWGTSNEAVTVLEYFSEADPPQMVVIGSSVAQTSIMPRRLSEELEALTGQRYSVVNLAGNYFSADLSYEFVSETLPHLHLPKLILYPLFPPDLGVDSPERVETYLKNSGLSELWYSPYAPRPLLIESEWVQYALNISTWATGSFKRQELNNYRGFNYQERIDLAVPSAAANFDFTQFSAQTLAAERLRALLEWGGEQGVMFILFPSPLPDAFVQSPQAQSGNLAAFRAFLADLAAQYPQVIYLDLFAEGGITLEHAFYDPVHVNVYGAEAWTSRLAQAMANRREEWQFSSD